MARSVIERAQVYAPSRNSNRQLPGSVAGPMARIRLFQNAHRSGVGLFGLGQLLGGVVKAPTERAAGRRNKISARGIANIRAGEVALGRVQRRQISRGEAQAQKERGSEGPTERDCTSALAQGESGWSQCSVTVARCGSGLPPKAVSPLLRWPSSLWFVLGSLQKSLPQLAVAIRQCAPPVFVRSRDSAGLPIINKKFELTFQFFKGSWLYVIATSSEHIRLFDVVGVLACRQNNGGSNRKRWVIFKVAKNLKPVRPRHFQVRDNERRVWELLSVRKFSLAH